MRTLVCIKDVGDISSISDPSELRFLRGRSNPLDMSAIEEALQLRSVAGGEIVAVTVGPAESDFLLKKALMMGVNEAVRVWDAELTGADPFGIALVLAKAAVKLSFDLILCGARSADTNSEIVGAALAEHLRAPLITRAITLRLDATGKRLIADRKLERGLRETYAVRLPAVLTIERSIEPRYSSPRWVHRLFEERVHTLGLSDIGFTVPLPTARVVSLGLVAPKPRSKAGVKLSGLSLKDQLAVMRGHANAAQCQRIVGQRPEETAKEISGHLDRWLD